NRQLCLIVKIDQAEAFAPSDAFGRTLVGMALVALVLATLLGIGLARTITIPIRVLQDGVVRFGRGERAVRLAETRRDEIGILAREFNQMATALVEQETQLRDYASQLEQKVQARTRELRESEQRFRSLYENSSVGIYRTTPDGRILLANPALVQMLGYASFDELARRNLEQEGFDPAYARADFIRVIEREGEIRGLESAWIRKDGTAFFVRESARAIRDLLGKIMYYDGVVEDVTDRKRAEEKLRASEERFRTVADFTYDWEYWMDMAGNYVYVSPSCERVTGYRAEEFTSNPRLLEAVVHPDDQPLLMRHVREELDRNEMTSLDFRIIRRDGEMRWLSHNCRMVHGADGRWLGRRGSNRDITDRKRAEEELNRLNTELEQRVAARTAQLQAVNQELEAFAYSVSHDLRAPLRAIDGFSRMILEDYGGKFDAEGQRLFNVIRSNAQKMDQLITDLLTLSRITRGALITSRLDMTTLVQQVFAEITPPEERGKVVLSVASLPEVEGEPAQMRQVWSNLLANALKFTRPKAERRIEVGGYVEDNRNVYFVKDNGVGFNPRYAHKLFGIFQRLHKASEFEGTGVGLAIVQRIIHRHGGKVWAEGELNQGATFYFSLPILIIQK
ncbi:MAG: PAS domain S-box protein, partial [Chloroflexota bacterium]